MATSGQILCIGIAVTLLLQGCGYGREMISLAARDKEVQQYFAPASEVLNFRKEILLPASCGKQLQSSEDCIEVWLGEQKAGWIYYLINSPHIWRHGYQRVDQVFIEAPGDKILLESIDTSGSKTTLYDGKEGK